MNNRDGYEPDEIVGSARVLGDPRRRAERSAVSYESRNEIMSWYAFPNWRRSVAFLLAALDRDFCLCLRALTADEVQKTNHVSDSAKEPLLKREFPERDLTHGELRRGDW